MEKLLKKNKNYQSKIFKDFLSYQNELVNAQVFTYLPSRLMVTLM